ncbi:MAG: hypothetical protein RI894_1531 [Bacteroidota bacterium]
MRPHLVREKFIFAHCLFCHITTTKKIRCKYKVLFFTWPNFFTFIFKKA